MVEKNFSGQLYLVVALGLAALAGLGVFLPLPGPLKLAAAMLLALLLPGWLLLHALRLAGTGRLEQVLLALGFSYALTTLISLGVLYVAGHLALPLLAGALLLVTLGLSLVCWWQPRLVPVNQALTRLEVVAFFIPVGVAAFFSLTNLEYADYWGDEMNGLLRAISIISGRSETIFEHTKGPVEILLPAAFGLLVGRFDPFSARFLFALAYIASVATYYLLARHLFGRSVALVAALFLAINGLYLLFGRLVQYQAIVFLMTHLALILVYRFYRGAGGVALWLSGLCVGVGLLAHYDGLLALLPIVYLVWQSYRSPNPSRSGSWPWLLAAALTLGGIGVAFYLPFLQHPKIADTASYLERVVSPTSWPSNNFDELYQFSMMANSAYYVVFITLLGLATIILDLIQLWRAQHRNARLWAVTAGVFGLAGLALLGGWPALIPLLLSLWIFGLLIGFADMAVERKVIYVWVGAAFILYVFFIDHPRNHFQHIYPGWTLLAVLVLKGVATTLLGRATAQARRLVLAAGLALFTALFALFSGYQYLLYLDIQREYVFTYPQYKSSFYWEDPNFPFGSRRWYGAPHRLGWQMINHMFAQGQLKGDWDSNDDGSNLFWYTLGWPRTPCYPRYYFKTQFVQNEDAVAAKPVPNLADYVQIGQIWNNRRLQIDVYEFAPLNPSAEPAIWVEPAHYSTAITQADFHSLPYLDNQPAITQPLPQPVTFQPNPVILPQIAASYSDPRIEQVRDKVALLGYDLDDTRANPGGLIGLTLYWRAVEVVNLPYKIFAHLESSVPAGGAPQLWAQADDFPACGTRSTQQWQVGQVVADRHIIKLPANLPPGEYVIQVGLYEPQTGLRLDWLDTLGNPQGVSFALLRLVVKP